MSFKKQILINTFKPSFRFYSLRNVYDYYLIQEKNDYEYENGIRNFTYESEISDNEFQFIKRHPNRFRLNLYVKSKRLNHNTLQGVSKYYYV